MENSDWHNLGFGYRDTDYNIRCYFRNGKWGELEICSSNIINIHMAATSLHYGQEAFEGLKAYKGIIGGEGNGGVILPYLHYGRDAVLAASLILGYLAEKKIPLSKCKDSFPEYFMIKEKIPVFNLKKYEKELLDKFRPVKVNRTDGLRLELSDGWVHLRQSGTEPIMRLIVESSTKERTLALGYMVKDILEK